MIVIDVLYSFDVSPSHDRRRRTLRPPFGRTRAGQAGVSDDCTLFTPSSMTTFQPRPSDACTWVAEAAFYDFDDELEEQEISLQDLQTGYDILHKAFTEANISFAALGAFVFSILGGREDPTHDVTFQINSTPVELFTKLRTMKRYVFS